MNVREPRERRPNEGIARLSAPGKKEDRRRLPNWHLRSEGGRMELQEAHPVFRFEPYRGRLKAAWPDD